jgi:hypothetical protein
MLSKEDEAILDSISPEQHKFTHKYDETFYWVEQQYGFALKFVCLHVGQMLFAGNKYLLLKRITVCLPISFVTELPASLSNAVSFYEQPIRGSVCFV